MSRLARLGGLVRVAANAVRTSAAAPAAQEAAQQAWKGTAVSMTRAAGFRSGAPTFAATPVDPTADDLKDYDHVTGLEKYEVEGRIKGVNVWEETWLNQPWGTEDNPVQVPSEYDSRIVGVPDPDDDSLVWWSIIEEAQPPKQIIEGGEYFVLKRLPSTGGHH